LRESSERRRISGHVAHSVSMTHTVRRLALSWPLVSVALLGVIYLGGLSLVAGASDEKQRRYIAWKFELVLPETVGVTTRKPAEDFELYSFFLRDGPKHDPLLTAHAGNFPQFPGELPPNATVEDITIGNLKAKSVMWTDAEGGFNRKVLVFLPKEFGVPQKVRLEYSKLSPEERTIADGIIESIKLLQD